jgi:uncharacterized phosphosugar-binding protein
MNSSGIDQYFTRLSDHLARVLEAQRPTMSQVAAAAAEAIQKDRLIYVFGSGHSRHIAGELYFRAGGLAPVVAIDDPTHGQAERIEGYAATFLSKYNIQPGDLLIVISNSGINAVPVEVAQYGRQAGAVTVAVTSLVYSQSAASRHSSRQKLYEVVDFVLDTMVPRGDAIADLPGYDWRVAPISTAVSVTMLDAVVAQVASNLVEAGVFPPVLISANVPEGDAHNQKMVEKYWQRLTQFPLRKD